MVLYGRRFWHLFFCPSCCPESVSKKDSARFQKGSLVLDTSSLYRNRSFGRQPVLRPQTYLYDRLLTALGLQHTDDGPGFTRLALQYEQTRFSLFGGSSVSDRLPREELYSTYLLHSIFLWFGIAAGILIIAALAFLRCTACTVRCGRATVWQCCLVLLPAESFSLSCSTMY